jgi:hypothetical protein
VADLQRPGLLHGAVVLSPHARARVLGIDVSTARALARASARGHRRRRARRALVRAAPRRLAGLRRRRRGGALRRRRPRRGRGRRRPAPPARPPALVASSTSRCRRARPDAALAPARRGQPEAPEPPLALGHPPRRRRRGLAASAHVVSGTWQTQRIEHLFLEPEARSPSRSRTGDCPLQPGPGHLRRPPAGGAFLGVPEERCPRGARPERRRLRRQGGHVRPGADGAARALTGRPVRLTLTREESIRLHPEAPPHPIDYTVGCDAEGRLTAVVARMIGDSGAYASVGGKVLERAAGTPAARTKVPRTWTSRPSPSTRTTRRAGRCAASAPTRRTSPSRAASTCSRRRPASTAGRSAGATRSAWATRSPPARCSRSRSASRRRCSR